MMAAARPPTSPIPVTTPSAGDRLRLLLEDRTRIEEEPEPVPREQLALFAELVPILLVTLLDACALAEVPLFTHADGLLSRLAAPRPRPHEDWRAILAQSRGCAADRAG